MKILLIAGHGAGDPGATATINGKKYQEATETRTVVPMIANALEGYADVTIRDTTRNAFADAQAGKLKAAEFDGYDYVLEVHFNAVDGSGKTDGKTKGVECFVTTSETGTSVEEAICKNIAALGFTNRGVKKKNWTVIHTAKKAGVSSALLEVCFIDDADDMQIYVPKRREIAQATAQGIIDKFGLQKTDNALTEAEKARAWVIAKGISDGSDPDKPVTRSQVWRMLMRMANM